MQQYRVNYTLLIGLLIGTVVTSGAVFGLWNFQIERKSDVLLGEAEKARTAGDNRSAAQFYSHYLSIHGEDPDTRLKLADAYADLIDQEDVKPEEVGMGIQVLEATVRELPNAVDAQRRLVEFYGKRRAYQQALDHLGYLLEKDPNNAELRSLRASYLMASGNMNEAEKESYKLIGYDPTTDKFDVKAAKAPQDVGVYTSLANILRGKLDKPELADRVIEQLIEANPESAQAYLSRGAYRMIWDEDEASGQGDIEKAYELAPEDENVLLVMVNEAAKKKDYEQAKVLIEKGKKLHPQDPSFYQAAAQILAQQQKYDESLAEINAGLAAVGNQKGGLLLITKADLQLQNNDLKAAKDTIEDMKRASFRPEFVDWYEARILVAEEKWFQASEALNLLRPKAIDMGEMLLTQIDFHLGMCYERLASLDLAERAYTEAAQRTPSFAPAVAGVQRVRAMRGLAVNNDEMSPERKQLTAELEKPKEERDWKTIEGLMQKVASERKLDDVQTIMMQVNVALMKEDFAAARKLLSQADKLKPNDLQIHRAVIQVNRFDPKVGPAKAMNVWNAVAKKFDDGPELRIDKADLIIAINNEQMKPDLAELMTGIDHWDDDQKVALWASMAGRYLNLGMVDEAKRYLTQVADARPNELPTRLSLFTLSLETNDDEGMKEAQKKILEIVKDTNDSRYLFTEARRQLSMLRREQLDASAIPAIRQMVDRAIKQRPDWHELYLLSGDLELQANNGQLAMEHFNTAEKLGRPTPKAVATHIRLLSLFGLYNQAAALLDRIPEQSREALLGALHTEILFRTNKVNDAIKEVRMSVEADPENAQKQQWFGQLLARSSAMPDLKPEQRTEATKQAIAALRKAVELEPELPDAWYRLITLNAQQQNMDAAQQALRDAQLALSGDNLQIFLAKSYEALGRWFDAETMYRAVYEAAPKDVRRAQQLAAFYISPVYQLPDRQAKLVPLLNQILKAADEVGPDGKKILAPNDPNLLWARRVGAEMLATTKDYQSLLKAENLLASSSQDGLLSVEDRLQMAQILASRPEPEKRLRAIGLLEDVSAEQPLSEAAELALGQLYFATDNWNKCQTQMQETIGRFQNSVAAREAYINMLLKRGDKRNNQLLAAQLGRLSELAPNNKATLALTVQGSNMLGTQKAVLADLRSRLPNISDPTKLTDEQANLLAFAASLYVELDDLEGAEKLYRQLTQRSPDQVYALANFLGTHRDVGQCFELLEQSYKADKVQDILTVGVNVSRARRDDVGDKYDAQMEDWLARALRDNPDSISLQMLQADFYDVQKRYEDAVGVYNKLLARKDLIGFRRAIVLNNLAFLAALAGSAGGTNVDTLKLVDEAESILGPSADILDTKAVVLIERKQFSEAIELLKLSLTDNPTGAKYFHLVAAHLGAGENAAALEAWEKAEAAGLTRDELNRLEHARYDEVKAKIDQLRKGSPAVTQTDSLRKAG